MPLPDLDTFLRRINRAYDDVRERIGFKSDKPVTIAAYRGFGRRDYLYLTGRVLHQRKLGIGENDRLVRNLIKNYRRFASLEISGAELEVIVGQHTFPRISDQEGYFKVEENLAQPLPDITDNWQKVDIRIKSGELTAEEVLIFGEILIPTHARLGIISDIDDTVLQSDVTSRFKLRTLYWTLLKNAGSRTAFKQVSAFYRALQKGRTGEDQNAFFYVSNSPWNLYDLLADFLDLNKLPKGPILLRDFGLPYEEKPANYQGHKHDKIIRIISTYPKLPFVLVGDSGEHDADIYLSVAQKYPERIRAIYIRDVLHAKRAERIKALIEAATDIPIRLVSHYGEAAEHANRQGLLDPDLFAKYLKE